MNSANRIIRDLVFVLLALVTMVALVAAIAGPGEHPFIGVVTFAMMVPVVGSTVVALMRDCETVWHKGSVQ